MRTPARGYLLAALILIGVVSVACAGSAAKSTVTSCAPAYTLTGTAQPIRLGSCAGMLGATPRTVLVPIGTTLTFTSFRDANGMPVYPLPTVPAGNHVLRGTSSDRFMAAAPGTVVLHVHSIYCNAPTDVCPVLAVTVTK